MGKGDEAETAEKAEAETGSGTGNNRRGRKKKNDGKMTDEEIREIESSEVSNSSLITVIITFG